MHQAAVATVDPFERETVLRLMSAAAFVIFFKSYLVAPLIPALAAESHSSEQSVGYLVPAYLLPYGFSTLGYGWLADRYGRRPLLLLLLGAMVCTAFGTATAHGVGQLIFWRVLAGIATGGIVPIALALLGDLFPYNERGRALGWVFGAIAGGMAFGSTLGALLNPIIGWRVLFVLIGVATAVILWLAVRHRTLLESERSAHIPKLSEAMSGYLSLLSTRRGAQTYGYIMLNGAFHSGVFTWLGLYFARRYQLGDQGIGLALLGYGIPGLMLGPMIGHLADRVGRRVIVPIGLILAAVSAAALAPHVPLALAVVLATVLSFGFDMSHPLLAGIVTSLDPNRRGQAMGLNAFVLFTGLGFGSLLFQQLLRGGFAEALLVFAAVQLVAGAVSVIVFRGERAAQGKIGD